MTMTLTAAVYVLTQSGDKVHILRCQGMRGTWCGVRAKWYVDRRPDVADVCEVCDRRSGTLVDLERLTWGSRRT